ncbi:MAG: hypothetical protein N2260_04970 [Syntrophobacterales bacterium]|nr:hypothetical protein [Syntrophobacterales bacterium]
MRNWSNPELAKVAEMVTTWKEAYFSQVGPGEGWEVLCDELREEILEFIYPYVRKLYLMKVLEKEEFEAFLHFCDDSVEELRNMIKEKNYASEV